MTSPPGPALPPGDPARTAVKSASASAAIWVVAVMAMIVQVFAALSYAAMGLGWGGLWYVLAAGQGAVILVVMIILLVLRRPLLTLPLPIVSALLVFVFWTVDEQVSTRICSPGALAAVNSLRHPPDLMEDFEFDHEFGRGCAIHFNSRLSETDLVQHYVDEGRRGGWEVVEFIPAERAVLRNSAWVVTAEVNTLDTGLYILGIERHS